VPPSTAPAQFRDKVVVVGVTARGLHDVFTTPLTAGEVAGPEVHAQTIDALLAGRRLGSVPPWQALGPGLWGGGRGVCVDRRREPENFATSLTTPKPTLGAGCGATSRLHNVSNTGGHQRRTGATPVHRCPVATLLPIKRLGPEPLRHQLLTPIGVSGFESLPPSHLTYCPSSTYGCGCLPSPLLLQTQDRASRFQQPDGIN
jgi:hypothetical protein